MPYLCKMPWQCFCATKLPRGTWTCPAEQPHTSWSRPCTWKICCSNAFERVRTGSVLHFVKNFTLGLGNIALNRTELKVRFYQVQVRIKVQSWTCPLSGRVTRSSGALEHFVLINSSKPVNGWKNNIIASNNSYLATSSPRFLHQLRVAHFKMKSLQP